MQEPSVWAARPVWHVLTRLGEAEILLPLALLTAATALTTASKLAFIGWGLGCAAINFTGVSGHTMFAAAIYPMLVVTLLGTDSPKRHRLALLLGCALALLIGYSRIVVQAHSWSEVLAGLLVGGAVTVAVLAVGQTGNIVLRPIVPALLLAWVAVTPASMPASQTHSMVTRLALQLSGHATPYTRRDLLRSAAPGPQ